MSSIKKISGKFKYTIVSNTSSAVKTTIVNMALSTNNGGSIDQFKAWGNINSIYTQTGVKDYSMNESWAVETKSFNNYVAFAITSNNEIWKISGVDPISQTKKDQKSFVSITDFKNYYKVCDAGNPNPPTPTVTTEIFYSDSCAANSLGKITFTTDPAANETACQSFACKTTSSVWGVKIGTACFDLADMPALAACRRSQVEPTSAKAVAFYDRSDSCSGTLSAALQYPDDKTKTVAYCGQIVGTATTSVWSIRAANGTCIDVRDVPVNDACQRFKNMAITPAAGQSVVNFYYSDYCNSNFMTRMILGANVAENNAACTEMAPSVTGNVWGTQKDSAACSNITDTTFINACSAVPTTGGVTIDQVQASIAKHKTTWATYNADTAAVSACKSAGAAAAWTATMNDYYCTFPGKGPDIRECFTYSVRGVAPYLKRTYPEAYDYCAMTHPGVPMKWIRDNEDSVFRAVMIDKKF